MFRCQPLAVGWICALHQLINSSRHVVSWGMFLRLSAVRAQSPERDRRRPIECPVELCRPQPAPDPETAQFFCLEKRMLILAWLRLLVPAECLSGVGTQLNQTLACLAPLPAPIMAT